MEYEFSLGSLFLGLLILITGVAFVRWHQAVANNFGGGVGSYDRYKFWAFVTCCVGFIVMLNLHNVILTWLFSTFFPHP